MKYTTEIIVELPPEEFLTKLTNIDNFKHWQKGLTSTEHISGTPGELGAKMKLNYDFGSRKMELIETITKAKSSTELHMSYTAKGMKNNQQNYFERTSEGFTKWISKSEFIPLNFVMRIFTLVMPSAFKKQSAKYMKDFKKFAENGYSVAHA